MAIALKGICSTDAISVDTRVIHQLTLAGDLASVTRVSRTTIASEGVVCVATSASVHARIFVPTVRYNPFAFFPGIADGTSTPEAIDQIGTDASIFTWVSATFIDIRLAVETRKSCKSKSILCHYIFSNVVQMNPVDGRQKHVVELNEQENGSSCSPPVYYRSWETFFLNRAAVCG